MSLEHEYTISELEFLIYESEHFKYPSSKIVQSPNITL